MEPKVLFFLLLAGVIIWLIVKNRSGNKYHPMNGMSYEDMPDDLSELRKLLEKSTNNGTVFQCLKKICHVGVKLYNEGKLVADPKDVNDVNALLANMLQLYEENGRYIGLERDEELDFFCFRNGVDMVDHFHALSQKDPDVKANFKFPAEFCQKAWPGLADFYTEGKVCPRDPKKAQLYWRMHIDSRRRVEGTLPGDGILGLMEIPAEGSFGGEEILKWINLLYGLDLLRIKSGKIVRAFEAQTLQQCAELMLRLDMSRIGSPDVAQMLKAYEDGVQAGNAYAQYKLGYFYLKGRYVDKNEEKGLELLKKAAEQDLYMAVNQLFTHYYWLAHPIAGDYGGATKQQIREYEKNYDFWSRRTDALLKIVEVQFADRCASYTSPAMGQPTNAPRKVRTQPEDD